MTELETHFFRREYSRLVAALSRRAGVQNMEAIEDAAQSALMTAVETWPVRGQPDNPSAWLFAVARNNLQGALRQHANQQRLLEQHAAQEATPTPIPSPEARLSGELQDDLLRMMFVCCDEAIPMESRLALALKVLCGFGVQEVAQRLFTSEASVYKRLSRARARLRDLPDLELHVERYAPRLGGVHQVLYQLFTEGYLSAHAQLAIRQELCQEAQRLTTILAEHTCGQTPQTFALLALMHLHNARLTARCGPSGGLLLLEEQDRSLWDQAQIQRGLSWLARSAQGDHFSRFHAEAGIAAEHCLAPSFEQTRWDRVVACYAQLERSAPSALHRLNRAVALAQWRGPAAGLALLESFEVPSWLAGSYLWAAVQSDLHRRNHNAELAKRFRKIALRSAPTDAIRALLERRLA